MAYESLRIRDDGQELLRGFRPNWHHVFPRKFLEGKVHEDLINAPANIAVIGPEPNIRINAKDPMDYVERYGPGKHDKVEITVEKLAQQFIGEDIKTCPVAGYEAWLNARAKKLADAGNAFLAKLKGEL